MAKSSFEDKYITSKYAQGESKARKSLKNRARMMKSFCLNFKHINCYVLTISFCTHKFIQHLFHLFLSRHLGGLDKFQTKNRQTIHHLLAISSFNRWWPCFSLCAQGHLGSYAAYLFRSRLLQLEVVGTWQPYDRKNKSLSKVEVW